MTRSLRVSQSSVSLPTPMVLLVALVVASTSWHTPPQASRISARHQPCIAVKPPPHTSFRHAGPVAAAGDGAGPNERFSLLPTREQISISKVQLGCIIDRTCWSFFIIVTLKNLGLKLLTANVAAASLLSLTEGVRSVARVTAPLMVVQQLLTTMATVVVAGPMSGLPAALLAVASTLSVALLQWLYIPAHFVSILAYGEGIGPITGASKEHGARMNALLRTTRLGASYCDMLKAVHLKLNGLLGALPQVQEGLLSVLSVLVPVVVIGPICEELVFRWLLQRGLQHLVDKRAATRGNVRPASRRVVYFIVSVLFALMHAVGPLAGAATASPTSTPTTGVSRPPSDIFGQVAYTGIASYTLFCPVFARYGLLGAIVSHASWNAFATVPSVIMIIMKAFKAASGAAV